MSELWVRQGAWLAMDNTHDSVLEAKSACRYARLSVHFYTTMHPHLATRGCPFVLRTTVPAWYSLFVSPLHSLCLTSLSLSLPTYHYSPADVQPPTIGVVAPLAGISLFCRCFPSPSVPFSLFLLSLYLLTPFLLSRWFLITHLPPAVATHLIDYRRRPTPPSPPLSTKISISFLFPHKNPKP